MTKELSENISNVLSIARLAPSVHNTQPWQVKVDNKEIIISINKSRALTHGDPTGRETFISLGIFTEACVLGLDSVGFKVSNLRLEKLEKVVLDTIYTGTRNKRLADIDAIENRFTDRSVYKKTEIKPEQKLRIESAWKSEEVKIKVVTDETIINRCAELTQRGLLLAMSSPDFRHELAGYLVTNSKKPTGIPIATLKNSRPRALLIKRLVSSGVGRKHEGQIEYNRWHSASALVFVLANGDSTPYWLESGRAYLRASLEIQKLGFRQATSAAIVEASDFHEDIEKLLKTNRRILCLMRIGQSKGPTLRSGRLSPSELLVT